MANIKFKHNYMRNLKQRAGELVSAAESLATLFENEAICLRRRNEVARLKVLRSDVLQRVERARSLEMAASYGHYQAKTVSSLFQLTVGLITMTSENTMMRAISHKLLTGPSGREPPYGTVLIRIGTRGLPEDVEVVSISGLARESNRDESQVIDRLLAGGNLLFGEESFSRLIDRLVGDILKERLILPVSAKRLSQLKERRVLRLNPRNREELT